MKAVIKTGAKQYYVEEGSIIYVEKLKGEAGSKVTFDEVLMLDDKIEDSEIEDFARIQDMLDQLSMLSRSLQIWVEEQVASGNLDGDALKKAKKF